MTNPRPQTAAELMALPVTGFGMEVHELTDADRASGYIMIRGRRANVRRGVNSISIPTEPIGFLVLPAIDDVMVSHTDEMGVTWGLALHESGRWFRKQL